MKIVDKRCELCGKTYFDMIDDETDYCSCGGLLKRIFGYNKPMQMLPHLNEHLGHEPVYIEDRQHFEKELKKRNLSAIPLKKPKNRQYFI